MGVSFQADFLLYTIGAGSFLDSFFSTVSYHLEPKGWGTRFPYLLKHLNEGKIENALLPKLLIEVQEIHKLLESFSPDKVIWNLDDLSEKPPWGDKISPSITSLANYFVTSEGEDFFFVFFKAIDDAIKYNFDLEIRNL